MRTATGHLRRLLEDAYDASIDTATDLRVCLRNAEKEVGNLIQFGSVQSVNKNSAGQSYAFGNGQLTATDLALAWRELVDLFDDCQGCLATASAATTAAAVNAEMKARLRPVYATRPDLRLLHCNV